MLPKISWLLMAAIACCTVSCSRKTSPASGNSEQASGGQVAVWLTDPSAGILFKQQNSLSPVHAVTGSTVISVQETQPLQTIDGFGYTLTGGSACHISKMDAAARASLLKELFAWDGTSIGTSYLRISMGSSDLDDHVFTYDDLPSGQTDTAMQHFSLAPDLTYLVPVLKQVLAINPAIKILGSPWSPPVWMKTNDSSKGGHLKPEFYNAYARYFVKYIQAMQQQGITIDAVTLQNEPLNPKNNPSMVMEPDEQAAFIKQSAGPAFRSAGISTKIILYDHNADRPDYPITILNDAAAKPYIDGSAFHLYGGTIDALSQVHAAHPDKNLYFTEQWVGAPGNLKEDLPWHVKNVVIGSIRNWSRNALEWNLAADAKLEPHTPGGCTECLGAVTIDGNNVTRNSAYYIIAHAAKFVRPGAVHIASNAPVSLSNAAFKTADGKKVLIVVNDGAAAQSFLIQDGSLQVNASLNAGAVATYVW